MGSMCLPRPWVDDSQASSIKRRCVARGYSETMRCRDGGNIAMITLLGLATILYFSGATDLLPLTWAMLGAVIGFLLFNRDFPLGNNYGE